MSTPTGTFRLKYSYRLVAEHQAGGNAHPAPAVRVLLIKQIVAKPRTGWH
jgi:DNA-directed RNA polymerase specialized sigma54-like protein